MPVVTRSKSKNNHAVLNSSSAVEASNPECIKPIAKMVNPKKPTILSWFVAVVGKGLEDTKECSNKKSRLQKALCAAKKTKVMDCDEIRCIKNDIRVIHYDMLRCLTETMYIFDQYFPIVSKKSVHMTKLAEIVYEKVHYLYGYLHRMKFELKPITIDEEKVMSALVSTFQDVEETLVRYLPKNYSVKRKRKFVDYRGMDTIEPHDEFDKVTNIWYDKTLATDPDY
jgi:hypothetical protein